MSGLPVEMGILLGVALLVAALGFAKFVWFISIGYGFSVAAMAAVLLVLFRDHLSLLLVLQLVLLAAYGLRLGTFLLRRELRQASYHRSLTSEKRPEQRPLLRKLPVWGGVALLYVLMVSPAIFNAAQLRAVGGLDQRVQAVGVAIMVLGLGLESTADRQKAAYKAHTPDRFCDEGLFRMVRYPNYLGEITFWVGNWVAGLAVYHGALQWIASTVGLLGIVLVMMNSTMMLEVKQNNRYGTQADYQRYTQVVPILFPGLPVYTFSALSKRINLRL